MREISALIEAKSQKSLKLLGLRQHGASLLHARSVAPSLASGRVVSGVPAALLPYIASRARWVRRMALA